MTQGDNKYGEQTLFQYFFANFYDILKVVFNPIRSLYIWFYSHTKSINLITRTTNLQLGLPVLCLAFELIV